MRQQYKEISFREPFTPVTHGSVSQSADFVTALADVKEKLMKIDDSEVVREFWAMGVLEFALRTGIGVTDNAEDMLQTAESYRRKLDNYCKKVPKFVDALIMLDQAVAEYSE